MANKTVKFITGNRGKFAEAQIILAPIKVVQLDIDVDEIQTLEHGKIIEHKIAQALKHQKGSFFIEDTCVYFKGLKNKLPGTFARAFWEALGEKGIYSLAKRLPTDRAEMESVIGWVNSKRKMLYFSSKVKGRIVSPKGKHGFGFDRVFAPLGTTQTLSELKGEGKYGYSPRCGAIRKLKGYLVKREDEKISSFA